MDFAKKILEIFGKTMEEPHMLGWFHIMWIAVLIAACVVICKLVKGTDKNVFRVILSTTVISILFEVYKQIVYTYTISDGAIVADYQWYAFPFQFCSMPMYIGLLYCAFHKTRIRHYFAAFLATYSLFGGLVVFIYPEQVFIETIGINIQTMVYHGIMILVAVWLLYTQYVPLKCKSLLKAFVVFVGCVAAAVGLNEHAVSTGFIGDETFNMFYISPHFEGTLPLYSEVQKVVPYPWSLAIYFVVFTLAAFVMLAIAMLCKKLFGKKNKSAKETVNV